MLITVVVGAGAGAASASVLKGGGVATEAERGFPIPIRVTLLGAAWGSGGSALEYEPTW